ncbi:hypothetical protein KSS87_000699 [Heliosperma pusillum]|nr:hypothetical protein KSS87_000699 [Heliosperma pusillum]
MTITDYMTSVKACTDDLAQLEHPMDIDDITNKILNGLDQDKYRSLIEAVRARDTPISFESLHEKLIHHELRIKNAKTIATPTTFQPSAHAANHSRNTYQNNNQNRSYSKPAYNNTNYQNSSPTATSSSTPSPNLPTSPNNNPPETAPATTPARSPAATQPDTAPNQPPPTTSSTTAPSTSLHNTPKDGDTNGWPKHQYIYRSFEDVGQPSWPFGPEKRRVLDVFETNYGTKIFVENGVLVEEKIDSHPPSPPHGPIGFSSVGVSYDEPEKTIEKRAEDFSQTIETANPALAYYNSTHNSNYVMVHPINSNAFFREGKIWYHSSFTAKSEASAELLFFAELKIAGFEGGTPKYEIITCCPLDGKIYSYLSACVVVY